MQSELGKTPLLFRYPGGKHYAIKLLKPFWEAYSHNEYREPFAGGGSVFFNKPLAPKNWLNDLDSELVTTMKVISDPAQRVKLIKKVKSEVASPERWREVLDMKPTTDLQTAFRYFYLNRTSFSGKLISPAWGYRDKRSLPPERWKERIVPCGEKLENCVLTSTDFEAVIGAPSEGKALMFVDPPYYLPAKKKHYRHGFEIADHHRLADSLKSTDHGFFLTYEDTPEVRKLYSWANIFPVNFFYRVENATIAGGIRKLGFELVVTNFDVAKFPSELGR